jgi:hypothetical protein
LVSPKESFGHRLRILGAFLGYGLKSGPGFFLRNGGLFSRFGFRIELSNVDDVKLGNISTGMNFIRL